MTETDAIPPSAGPPSMLSRMGKFLGSKLMLLPLGLTFLSFMNEAEAQKKAPKAPPSAYFNHMVPGGKAVPAPSLKEWRTNPKFRDKKFLYAASIDWSKEDLKNKKERDHRVLPAYMRDEALLARYMPHIFNMKDGELGAKLGLGKLRDEERHIDDRDRRAKDRDSTISTLVTIVNPENKEDTILSGHLMFLDLPGLHSEHDEFKIDHHAQGAEFTGAYFTLGMKDGSKRNFVVDLVPPNKEKKPFEVYHGADTTAKFGKPFETLRFLDALIEEIRLTGESKLPMTAQEQRVLAQKKLLAEKERKNLAENSPLALLTKQSIPALFSSYVGTAKTDAEKRDDGTIYSYSVVYNKNDPADTLATFTTLAKDKNNNGKADTSEFVGAVAQVYEREQGVYNQIVVLPGNPEITDEPFEIFINGSDTSNYEASSVRGVLIAIDETIEKDFQQNFPLKLQPTAQGALMLKNKSFTKKAPVSQSEEPVNYQPALLPANQGSKP